MQHELIFVSQVKSASLYKSLAAHLENNPLIVSRYDTKTGLKIETRVGSNISDLPSILTASYYFISDLRVHEKSKLDSEDITAFLLAYSDRCVNNIVLSGRDDYEAISLVMFEFMMGNVTNTGLFPNDGIFTNLIDTFP